MVYSDASISTYGVGWKFTIFKNGFCIVHSSGALSRFSFFRAEAFAFMQAMIYVRTSISVCRFEMIEFCVDSQGLVKALKQELHCDWVLAGIKEELRKMHKFQKRVLIRWVPSHKNIFGNDVADKLAKKGTDNRHQASMK